MMWWNNGSPDAGQWVGMSLMMVLFWGLLALAIYAFIRALRPEPQAPATPAVMTQADAVLAERFARGEIDADEYAERRAILHSTPKTSAG